MKTISTIRLAVAASLAACLSAHAQTSAQTPEAAGRERLAGAVRNGEVAFGDLGLAPREQMPWRYARPAAVGGASREQVRAALEDAQRSGDLFATGDSSLKLNELHPSAYPARTQAAGKTRAQVVEELSKARRTGELIVGGELGAKLNELHPLQYLQVWPAKIASAPRDAASAAN